MNAHELHRLATAARCLSPGALETNNEALTAQLLAHYRAEFAALATPDNILALIALVSGEPPRR